jgi:hypothetical protein
VNQGLDLVFKAIGKKMMMINWSEPCSPFFKAIGEEMMVERKKNLGHTQPLALGQEGWAGALG